MRKVLFVLAITALAGVVTVWLNRSPILQWGVNTLVMLLEDVGGVQQYVESQRIYYLTEDEARIDVRAHLRTVEPTELHRIRQDVIDHVWNDAPPWQQMPADISDFQHPRMDRMPTVAQARQFRIDMPHDAALNTIFLQTLAPEPADGPCLYAYHQGHDGQTLGERGEYEEFLKSGCDVLSIPMPLLPGQPKIVVQDGGVDRVIDTHDGLAFLQTADFSPIQYFLTPTIVSLNAALAQKSYTRIAAVGLSGGAWTATVLAAVDPRISHLYAVAGTLPTFQRAPGSRNRGDWEYNNPAFYAHVNYFELYLLGVLEPRRRAFHIYNRYDPCCFNAALTAGFSAQIEGIAERAGLGHLEFYTDETGNLHAIMDHSLKLMIRDFASN